MGAVPPLAQPALAQVAHPGAARARASISDGRGQIKEAVVDEDVADAADEPRPVDGE